TDHADHTDQQISRRGPNGARAAYGRTASVPGGSGACDTECALRERIRHEGGDKEQWRRRRPRAERRRAARNGNCHVRQEKTGATAPPFNSQVPTSNSQKKTTEISLLPFNLVVGRWELGVISVPFHPRFERAGSHPAAESDRRTPCRSPRARRPCTWRPDAAAAR